MIEAAGEGGRRERAARGVNGEEEEARDVGSAKKRGRHIWGRRSK